jgi:flagellar basal-body rod modification protein FlgD
VKGQAVSTVQTASSAQNAILEALSSSKSTSGSTSASGSDRFLTLLTTQLKNQDPLNPMDNAQMTSQLAQISTVDGIEKLNTTLQSLLTNATESETLQAAALVGHGVMVPGTGLTLKDGSAIGGVELSEAADNVTVTIKNGNGLVVRTMQLGALDAGSSIFQWDGKNDAGETAANGRYTMSAAATRSTGTVVADALQLGVVSSVARTTQGAQLNLGTLGAYKLTDIKQII